MHEAEEKTRRQRALASTLALPEGPPCAEQLLVHSPEDGVQHVLYRSQATTGLRDEHLTDLLQESQVYNEQHQITGLLCAGAGFFIQLLEGPADAGHALYAQIQHDPRHHHVTTLRYAPSPMRFFADWHMASVGADPLERYWLLTHRQARHQPRVLPRVPITDPHLLTRLAAFQAQAPSGSLSRP